VIIHGLAFFMITWYSRIVSYRIVVVVVGKKRKRNWDPNGMLHLLLCCSTTNLATLVSSIVWFSCNYFFDRDMRYLFGSILCRRKEGMSWPFISSILLVWCRREWFMDPSCSYSSLRLVWENTSLLVCKERKQHCCWIMEPHVLHHDNQE